MSEHITEWEFTADVKGWIDKILTVDRSLPFSEAKCEKRAKDSSKRRDLTLYDKDKRIVLTGEVKLPYQKDGGSPLNEAVVHDARQKAINAKVNYFFTWNVNEFVLWETHSHKTAIRDRKFRSWKVVEILKPSHMDHPTVISVVQRWLQAFLHEFTKILEGKDAIAKVPPDDKFVNILESFLTPPINLTIEELEKKYENKKFKSILDSWMRDEQGWTISDDPADVRDNLERAAKFACYALVNKLVFYEALLKRYGGDMPKLTFSEHIDTGEDLRANIHTFFEDAKKATGDYETVFGEELRDMGESIPFYSDKAVSHWRDLITHIHQFDFTKLNYDVIGKIFERLISPEERHKYGQHYTRPEVVDLINSFCIRNGDDTVMDPACGGGTFLVRAYYRKRELSPGRRHRELLSDLYGVDLSRFAAHLTTINLATRDLVGKENYPQVTRSDFFDVMPDKRFMMLPAHQKGAKVKSKGLGTSQNREVVITELDAIVGNPPYVRQEEIRSNKKKVVKGTKEYYAGLLKEEWGLTLSGRSDLHCYFWPHAVTFLKEGGYFGFLTSSQWLDVEYGFRLQDWILQNFELLAVFESVDEPWFIGARVVTAVTVLRREPDENKRMENIVRFVQLRDTVADLLAGADGTTAGDIHAADDLRDEILSLNDNTVNSRYRARLVRQGDLWDTGVKLGKMLGKNDNGEYYGGKWGVHLRAPDLWFWLLEQTGQKWAPLGDIAEVRFGVKSGKDEFFFPKDISSDALSTYEDAKEFESHYGVKRKDVSSGKVKIVSCGKGRGEVRAIESEYLEPEVHSLMEIDGFTVGPEDCSRQILLVSKKKDELKGTHVLDYIEWGESQGFNTNATCIARVTESREWYDLTGHERAPVFWPKERQYKHISSLNESCLVGNCRLYEIYPPDEMCNPLLWGGLLNSSFAIISSLQFGRPVGNEGNWSTMVVDVNMMLVPDPRKATKKQLDRVAAAFEKMKGRKVLQFLSERRMREMAYTQAGKADQLRNLSDECELDMPDRRELDDAVLDLLGVKTKKERDDIIRYLYGYLREFYEDTRRKEEKAIANKKRAGKKGAASPRDIAAQIFKEVDDKEPKWLKEYRGFVDTDKPYDAVEIPRKGAPRKHSDLFVTHGVTFGNKGRDGSVKTRSETQTSLVILLAEDDVRGFVRIPYEEKECQAVFDKYRRFVDSRNKRLMELVEERTADEDTQEKIFEALLQMVRHRQ